MVHSLHPMGYNNGYLLLIYPDSFNVWISCVVLHMTSIDLLNFPKELVSKVIWILLLSLGRIGCFGHLTLIQPHEGITSLIISGFCPVFLKLKFNIFFD